MDDFGAAIGTQAGIPLTPMHHGGVRIYRVKDTDTHEIDVVEQIVNWRVCSTDKRLGLPEYDAGYCYIGKGVDSFTRAVLGAYAWDGPGHGDPPGYDKNAHTGVWREGSPHAPEFPRAPGD